MKLCQDCTKEYDNALTLCPVHGKKLSFKDPYDLVGISGKDTIDGKYRLDKVIAVSSMSVIYSAHHLPMNRKVALKMPLPHQPSYNDVVDMFVNEAVNAGKLYHPNIAVTHDAGLFQNNVPYVVTQWIEGQTLEDLISQGPQTGK